MDYCNFEEDYVTECGAGDNPFSVKCTACGVYVATLKTLNELDPNYQIADFRTTEFLLSYRTRKDSTIGLQCICGNNSLSLETAITSQAQFNTEESLFILE